MTRMTTMAMREGLSVAALLRRTGAVALLGAVALSACSSSPHSSGFVSGGATGSGSGGAGGAGAGTGGASMCAAPAAGGASVPGGAGIVVDATPAEPSAGCGTATAQATGEYARFTLTVPGVAANATDRIYYVRLPAGYDPAKAYRTVYLGPGCGPPQDVDPTRRKTYAMETASMGEAILVAMEPGLYNKADYNSASCTATTCEYCFDDMAANSVEYPYFDGLHKAVEAKYCVDKQRQFFAGYSSGGWMAHQLGCAFPDVLRAQASVTGGLPPSIANCQKTCADHPVAAFLIHDFNDHSNVFAGSVAARDRLLAANGCAGTASMTADYQITGIANTASFFCKQYTACPAKYPVVFCQSTDQAHGSQPISAVAGFWEFFSKL